MPLPPLTTSGRYTASTTGSAHSRLISSTVKLCVDRPVLIHASASRWHGYTWPLVQGRSALSKICACAVFIPHIYTVSDDGISRFNILKSGYTDGMILSGTHCTCNVHVHHMSMKVYFQNTLENSVAVMVSSYTYCSSTCIQFMRHSKDGLSYELASVVLYICMYILLCMCKCIDILHSACWH